MNQRMVKMIETEATSMNLRRKRMFSGAGQDTQSIATIAPCGMIFVPSKEGASHVPDEFTELDQLAKGTTLLLRVVRLLSVEVA